MRPNRHQQEQSRGIMDTHSWAQRAPLPASRCGAPDHRPPWPVLPGAELGLARGQPGSSCNLASEHRATAMGAKGKVPTKAGYEGVH